MANRASALLRQAQTQPDKVAIVHAGGNLTFGELGDRVRRTATWLGGQGIGRGSHVGILLSAAPDFIIVQQALFMLGAVITPLNVMYRASEIAHAVGCCDLTYIVTDEALLAGIDPANLPQGCQAIVADKSACADALPGTATASIAPDDPVMLLMTSATTGKAKGVILTAGNLAANYDHTPEWLGLSSADVILCALPLYNTFGLNQGINATMVLGCTLVLLPRFDVAGCIAAVARHGCTFLPAVPTMLQRLYDDPAATPTALRSLRLIMTGGAPVPGALLERMLAKTPEIRVLTGYGLTEGTALVTLAEVTLGADGEPVRGGTIGRVLGGMELAIRAEDGSTCPAGTPGEIVIRGPNVMAGYYHSPEDTAQALRAGWLHSGDIGLLDKDGFAYIVDRKKDVIIRGGQNIYPAEIEEALYGVEGVAEAAVIGIPDADMGEVPVAFIAFARGSFATVDSIIGHCQQHLARFKVPAAIHIRDELPKGPTGKILRRALREEVGNEARGA